MSKHVTISPGEALDRLAIRELVGAYAHCADRRDAKGQMSLFTIDTHFTTLLQLTSKEAPRDTTRDTTEPMRLVDITALGSLTSG